MSTLLRMSKLYAPTLKEDPSDADVASAKLLARAGMIRKEAAGLFTFMPLGMRVLHKIENIIREEMDSHGAQEVLMPFVQSAQLWHESGRWNAYGDELLRFHDRHNIEFCLGPTHEEVITDLVRNELNSYKNLPVNLYHIQLKFRDERRPRFGLLRSREFIMKDAYSFDSSTEGQNASYATMRSAYQNIFDRIGFDYCIVQANAGEIGGTGTEEFMALADTGECEVAWCECGFATDTEVLFESLENTNATKTITVDTSGNTAHTTHTNANNVDIINNGTNNVDETPDNEANTNTPKIIMCPHCGKQMRVMRGIEIGQIFKLGCKYSEAMGATFMAEDGSEKPLVMGCYGIGVSRTLAAAVEQCHDDAGIIWPTSIAPAHVCILPLNNNEQVINTAESIAKSLVQHNFDVCIDDRSQRAGVKFAEADLIGWPAQIIIGQRSLEKGNVEIKNRKSNETITVDLNSIPETLKNLIGIGPAA